jgi:hypothetical protein
LVVLIAFVAVDIAVVSMWRHHRHHDVKPPVAQSHPARTQPQIPRFEDYRCTATLSITPRPPDLSDPQAHTFRTRLTEGAKSPPDFAGFYTVVEWGCGSPCQTHALIDRRTGKVYFFPDATSLGAEYRVDSLLFVANPPKDVLEYYEGKLPPANERLFYSYYYVWEEAQKQFQRIYTDNPKDIIPFPGQRVPMKTAQL